MMEIYQTAKNEIKTEIVYDNIKGSTLLFVARSGWLNTRYYRRKFADDDNNCAARIDSVETIGHILFGCRGVNPDVNEDIVTLP